MIYEFNAKLKKIRSISKGTTVFAGVIFAFACIALVLCIVVVTSVAWFSDIESIFNEAPGHELTGGYEILGGLFLCFFEALAAAVLVLFGVIVAVFTVIEGVQLFAGVHALKALKRGKLAFASDAIVKLVCSSLCVILDVWASIENRDAGLLYGGVIFLVILIFSIYELVLVTKLRKYPMYNSYVNHINENAGHDSWINTPPADSAGAFSQNTGSGEVNTPPIDKVN